MGTPARGQALISWRIGGLAAMLLPLLCVEIYHRTLQSAVVDAGRLAADEILK